MKLPGLPLSGANLETVSNNERISVKLQNSGNLVQFYSLTTTGVGRKR